MSSRKLRLRALLGQQYVVVVAALVVLALVGGAATYSAHVDPGTTTEERVSSTWESSPRFTYAATVTQENPAFAVGRELPNRTVYFAAVSPVLNGSYAFSYRASDDGNLAVTTDLALVTRGVAEDGDGEVTVLWETNRTLYDGETVQLAPGETVRAPFSVNASALQVERDRIQERLGEGVGETETFVRATVDIQGVVNGRDVDRQQVHQLPVTPEGNVYRVGPAEASVQQFETTRSVTVPREYGPLRSVAGPALLFVSFLGAAALVTARSRNRLELTEAEREWLAYREDRAEFDEWITTFLLPTEVFDRPEATASSLADLVDFAIDTDSGVVESPDGTEYYVLHDGLLYLYTAPIPPELGSRGDDSNDGHEDEGHERDSDDEDDGDDVGTAGLGLSSLVPFGSDDEVDEGGTVDGDAEGETDSEAAGPDGEPEPSGDEGDDSERGGPGGGD